MQVNNELIWQKLEKIDDKISGSDGLFAINSRLKAIEERLDKVETRLGGVEKTKLTSKTFYWFQGLLITILIAAFGALNWWISLLHK